MAAELLPERQENESPGREGLDDRGKYLRELAAGRLRDPRKTFYDGARESDHCWRQKV